MAVPQGLLFMGLRNYGARPIDAAITEAAIPGLILIYLFASQRRITWRALIAATMVLLGLASFLGFFNGMAQAPIRMTTGSWFLLVSAVFTSFGLICDDKMAWPAEPAAVKTWRWQVVHKAQVTKSLRKTLFGSLISGVLTLMLIPVLNPVLGERAVQVLAVPTSAWPGIVALALVGTCLTWFSIFLLIQMQQMVLIVALVAGIPVVSAAYNLLSGRFERALQGYEWFGGALLIVSLFALIYVQLMRPTQTQVSATANVEATMATHPSRLIAD
jgi:hypothetical protein